MARLLPVLILLLALQFIPAAQPQTSGAASLQGIVVRAGTAEPLPGARITITPVTSSMNSAGTSPVVAGSTGGLPAEAAIVTISANAPTGIPSAITDADGRFSFQNLEAGLYSLQVLRDGYARLAHGQRTPGGPASAIRLSAGQSISNIVMSLVPAGNVNGVIRAPNGQPQAGVPVQLLRATFNASGQRAFQVEGSARTNDRGEYRLYWLTPGRYYIGAGTAPGPNRASGSNAPGSPNEIPERSFTWTYYPGVLDARAAALVDVSPGGELNGVDFTVAPQQLHRIRGTIVDSRTGRPPLSAGLSLAYRTLSGASGAFSAGERYNNKTGEFELRNVPPGSYVLQAIALDQVPAGEGEALVKVGAVATRANARIPIDLPNQDIEGVSLMLTTGLDIPGRITVDGVGLSALAGWERIRVALKPTLDSSFGPSFQPAAPVPQAPRADGTFVISGVSTGEFSVGPVTGLPAGIYVKEARFANADVLGQPLRFSGTVGGSLEIVLGARAGQLDGVALDARSNPVSGARIVLVPEQRNRTDLFKTTSTDSTGRFLIRSIPPGDYRVFGWDVLDSYAYFDQDLLRRVEPQGIQIRVAESAASNLTVRIIPSNP